MTNTNNFSNIRLVFFMQILQLKMKKIFRYKFYILKIFTLFLFLSLILIKLFSKTHSDFYLTDYLKIKNNPSNLSIYYSNICAQNSAFVNTSLSVIFKIHVIYIHYLETTDEKSIENFKFFINFGYQPCSSAVHFTFIFNTDQKRIDIFQELKKFLDEDSIYQLRFCKNTIVKYQFNHGNDICSFVKLLQTKYWKSEENEYQFYFYINSSVRGPFLPAYWRKPW